MFDLIKGDDGHKVLVSSDAVIYLFNSIKFLGFCPPTNKYRIPYLIYSTIVTFFCVLALPFLFNISLYRDRNNLSIMEVLTSIQGSLNAFAIPVKSITLALSLKRLRSIEQILQKLDGVYSAAKVDKAMIRNCAIMCNRLVFGFAIAYFTYEASLVAATVLNGRVPYSIWIPYLDWRRSAWEYYVQIVFDSIMVFFALYHQVVNDTYPAVYIYIIRTQIQLLAKRVERLGYNEKKSDYENYNELKECIAMHQDILTIVNIAGSVISITVFAQFFVAAAILSVTMVNIVVFANLSTKIASAFYYFCVLLQTSPTCYHASYLLEDCDALSMAIFQCNWSKQSKRFHNLLIYFLQRSQDRIPLFAMKLVPINLATNLSIAKFSFTLYTFIQKMGVDEKLKG